MLYVGVHWRKEGALLKKDGVRERYWEGGSATEEGGSATLEGGSATEEEGALLRKEGDNIICSKSLVSMFENLRLQCIQIIHKTI